MDVVVWWGGDSHCGSGVERGGFATLSALTVQRNWEYGVWELVWSNASARDPLPL